MPRPGRNIEEQLLRSGRKLYAERGAAGLSVRALTEHAGVNLGMFHYHFRTKDEFFKRLLGTWYEQMFDELSLRVREDAPPMRRLEEALFFLAGFLREQHAMLTRVLIDAATGHEACSQFLRDNAPRHLRLLLALLDDAERQGWVLPMAPMQRFTFVMSAVNLPLLIAPRVRALGAGAKLPGGPVAAQVSTDEAIRERIALVLRAISTGKTT